MDLHWLRRRSGWASSRRVAVNPPCSTSRSAVARPGEAIQARRRRRAGACQPGHSAGPAGRRAGRGGAVAAWHRLGSRPRRRAMVRGCPAARATRWSRRATDMINGLIPQRKWPGAEMRPAGPARVVGNGSDRFCLLGSHPARPAAGPTSPRPGLAGRRRRVERFRSLGPVSAPAALELRSPISRGGCHPARTQCMPTTRASGSSARWSRATVARPIAVRPSTRIAVDGQRKCSAQRWVRGWNRGTSIPVSGSQADVRSDLNRLHSGQLS